MNSVNKYRLSKEVKPIRYQITIRPQFADFTFTGNEDIRIKINQPVKKLTLHAADLTISKAEWRKGKVKLVAKKIKFQAKSETVTIEFTEQLLGTGELYLEFAGIISDQLRGFYRSRYTHQQEQKYLATTQFEATDARRAFPCFDEPSHKAVFDVRVIVPKHQQVISNTVEEVVEDHEPGFKIVKFSPTPRMSSYLLAYVIGEFESVETVTERGTLVRVHTTPGKKKLTKFSLEVAKRALEYLESYFDIPYPLPALDLIAIPDFSAGAMENWGAITFRETTLLVDEQHTAFLNKQRVAEVIAHELVHQWFGNLVTMEWWTHLWLNESFANYMAYHVVDKLFPEWNFWTKFVLEEQSYALEVDSLHRTHPIEVPVQHPDQINEIFDDISYAKGASILRMVEFYVGSDNFRDALRLYLKKHSYKNTESVHLWQAFDRISKKPVSDFIANWLLKPGYPVIGAQLSGNRLKLNQKVFKQLNSVKAKNQVWQIPVQEQLKKDEQGKLELFSKSKTEYKISPHYQFIKLNPGEQSFYIVDYSPEMLEMLVIAIKNQDISAIDRLAILRNAFLLVKAGQLSADLYLDVINQIYQTETSYIVWSELTNHLSEVNSLVYASKTYGNFQSFKQKIYGNLLQRLGTSAQHNESHQTGLLRGLALAQAGVAGHGLAIKTAKALYKSYRNSKITDPDLRLAMLLTVAQHGSIKTYQEFIKLYQAKTLEEERKQILAAALRFGAKKVQDNLLKFIFTDEVRSQDLPFLLRSGLMIASMKSNMWQEIVANMPQLVTKFGNTKLMGRIFEGAERFNTAAELKKFDKLIRNNSAGAKQSIEQTRERILINISWRKRDLKNIERYLKQVR